MWTYDETFDTEALAMITAQYMEKLVPERRRATSAFCKQSNEKVCLRFYGASK